MQKLSMEDFQLMGLLERITGAKANDVISDENSLIFAVPDSEFGRAVGKKGANIERLEHVFKKHVEIVKSPNSKEQFFGFLFSPVIPKELAEKEIDGKRTLDVVVETIDRGLAIGRNGERIKKAKMLGKRYFNYDDVRIVVKGGERIRI
ncbi:MAG: NusA-like transcription termination signal-binding factor [Candidatus Micrarchaeota archaeon]